MLQSKRAKLLKSRQEHIMLEYYVVDEVIPCSAPCSGCSSWSNICSMVLEKCLGSIGMNHFVLRMPTL